MSETYEDLEYEVSELRERVEKLEATEEQMKTSMEKMYDLTREIQGLLDKWV